MIEERRPTRQSPRVGFEIGSAIPAEVWHHTLPVFPGWITVLSERGAFLEVSEHMPVRSSIALRFVLPGNEEEIVCGGIVRNRVLGLGVGVEFTLLSPSERDLMTVSVIRPMLHQGSQSTLTEGTWPSL